MERLYIEFISGGYRVLFPGDWTEAFFADDFLVVKKGSETILCAPARNLCYYMIQREDNSDGD